MPARVGRLDAVLGMDAQPDAGADRERLVLLRFLQEQRLHLVESLRFLRRPGRRPARSRFEVIELPDVLGRIPVSRAPGLTVSPRDQRAERAGDTSRRDRCRGCRCCRNTGCVLRAGAFGVGERVGHADAVDRVLLEAVDDLRRLDAEDVVDRRHDVVDVMELRPRRLVRLDALRPGDRQRIAGAAEMRGDQLGVVERRAACPRPAGVIHVVGLRRRRARRARRSCSAPRAAARPCSGFWFCASSSLIVPFWPSALEPLSPKM